MANEFPQSNNIAVNEVLLKDFVDGRLDSAMQIKVAAFIEKNPELLARVEAMSSDGFIAKIRSAGREVESFVKRMATTSLFTSVL